MYVYSYNGAFIAVDAGYGFLNDNYPGIDLCFADASYFREYGDKFEGIFITHAHEDHFGAIAQLWPMLKCPVYATDFAIGLMKNRVKEYGLEKEINFVSTNAKRNVKTKNFEVDFVSILHSVPETAALIVKAGGNIVVHATDWRLNDGAFEVVESLRSAISKGVDMFICDSTNIMVDGAQPTEAEVREYLGQLVPTLKNAVVATCFASNLVRLESLMFAAEAAGRTPVLIGRSLITNFKIARELGYFKAAPKAYDIVEAKDISADNALYICTGSQANYRSALSSIVAGQHRWVKLHKGDNVIFSSKIIPGNEEKIGEMQESLVAQGVNVITDRDGLVHTSGHANREDTAEMYRILNPKILLPVHGDKKFIREHKRFGLANGIKEVLSVNNGDVLKISSGRAKIVGQIPTDVLAIDRTEIISLNSEVIKRRKQIAYNGSVFISIIFGEKWELIALRVSSKDILEPEAFALLRDKIVNDISAEMPDVVKRMKYKEEAILDYVRTTIRRKIEKATEMKPVTFIHFYKLPLADVNQSDDIDPNQPVVIYPETE